MKKERIRMGYELYLLLTILSGVCLLVCGIALLIAEPARRLLESIGWKTGHWTYAQVLSVGLAMYFPYLYVIQRTYKRILRPHTLMDRKAEGSCIKSGIRRLISQGKRELKIGAAFYLGLCVILWSIAGVLFWLYYNRSQNMVLKYFASPIICSAYFPLFCCVRNLLFSLAKGATVRPTQKNIVKQAGSEEANKNAIRFHYDARSNSIWVGTQEDIQRERRKRGEDIDFDSPPSDEEIRRIIMEMLGEEEK